MGLRGKRGRDKKTTGWIRDTVLSIYTDDMVKEDWKAVQPAERLKIVSAWVPKELKVESDTTISLIINGLRQVNAIDSAVVKALDAHDPEDED